MFIFILLAWTLPWSITHPGGLVPSLQHYTVLADPRPEQLGKGIVIPFGPVAFSPQ